MQHFPLDPKECADIVEASRKYILKGLIPKKPFLPRSGVVSTAGSCFARNINEALVASGIKAVHLEYNEKMNTPPITNTLFERALLGTEFADFGESLRLNRMSIITHGIGVTPNVDGKPVAEPYTRVLRHTGLILLKPNQVAETTLATIEQIRKVNPDSVVVLTVSPLPLGSSLTTDPVFILDCLSKSTLRVGVEYVMSRGLPNVFYWPSFEIVRWLSPHIARVFGVRDAAEGSNRHLPSDLVRLITDMFIETYFLPEA